MHEKERASLLMALARKLAGPALDCPDSPGEADIEALGEKLAPRAYATEAGPVEVPQGLVWVCQACGKRARSRYGMSAKNGWDVSCMLNAVLCFDEPEGPWAAVPYPFEKEGGHSMPAGEEVRYVSDATA